MTSAQVIIIGAGMAGIKTAIDLYNGGIKDILILEARDRLGGRLVSIPSTRNPLVSYDLGASWFHDVLANPLFTKARKLKNVRFFFDDGKRVTVSEHCLSVLERITEDVVSEMRTFAAVIYSENPSLPDMSVRQLCDLYIQEKRDLLTEEQIKYAPQVLRMWDEMWGGVSWDKVSVKLTYLADDESHLGRNAFNSSGYSTVFENELAELPEAFRSEKIKLNTTVDFIDYSDPRKVIVKTSGKGVETFKCDYLVVTIPFNVLSSPSPSLIWQPALPSNFSGLFKEDIRGSLGKVVLEFNQCFWPKDVHRFFCLASENDPAGSPKPWKHPALIVNYYAMAKLPSLVILTQDPLSSQLEEMTNEEIWQIFKPMIAKIASVPLEVEDPFNIHITRWNKDPLTQGAYTMPKVGGRTTAETCQLLCEGLSDRVRFAGAETQAGSANGCAHGAWYSGRREAGYILEQIRTNKPHL